MPATMLLAMALLWASDAPARSVVPQEADGGVTVEPSRVDVTMLYHGRTIQVRAPVPSAARVAIVLRGEARSLELKRKGKVLGLIWMNVDDVTFPSVPELYLLRTTCPLMDLGDPALLARLGLGWEALALLSTGTDARNPLFGELVTLKERDGLWDIEENGVHLEPAADGTAMAIAELFLPARTPPGDYSVLAYAFTGGEATLLGEGRVRVSQTGVAEFITNLARSHGLLYGVMAVLAAGAAGLLTGVVFGLGDRKGHG